MVPENWAQLMGSLLLQSPQGILALVKQYHYTLDEVAGASQKTGKPALLMVLETIQDPGNLGTILRAGEGAGVTGVVMDANTADIYNPKVIRSTMGSVLRMPFVYVENQSKSHGKAPIISVTIGALHT